MSQVLVVGEALMDLIPVSGGAISEMVGGGPCNSAKALARLGFSTTFIGGISSDSYGEAIEKELLNSGVSLDFVHRSDLPTALAIATINEAGLASYEFKLDSTVSFNFHSSWLPKEDAEVIHIGSVATLLEPGASELYKWLSSKSATVVFDPNVRPSTITAPIVSPAPTLSTNSTFAAGLSIRPSLVKADKPFSALVTTTISAPLESQLAITSLSDD